jgi:Peptidase M15
VLITSAGVLLGVVIAGCGSSHHVPVASTSVVRAHPHAVEPAAGVQAPALTGSGAAPVGDPTAHAPPLSQVRRELTQLNRCGGAITAAEAQPFFNTGKGGPGFIADPGTIQNVGLLPELTARLDALAKALKVTIYGISGYRTPAHSVAVGGYADDPHTKGEAEDIGVNSLLRSSAAQISEAALIRFGLYRPFDPSDDPNNTEVNHIQLIPAGGLPAPSQANLLAPDPTCT